MEFIEQDASVLRRTCRDFHQSAHNGYRGRPGVLELLASTLKVTSGSYIKVGKVMISAYVFCL